MTKLQKAILHTLTYADIFDYALTFEEIHKFLIGQYARRETQDEIKKELSKNPYLLSHISYHDGFYCLKGRKKIMAIRKRRKKWSQKKMKIARRVAGWLSLILTIKMVAVTGALAMENSEEKDDIDLLIVTAKNRLWLTRLLTVLLVELVAQRRRPDDKEVKDKICLNMFLDEVHLAMPKKERDLFSAHEVCQLKPLWQREAIYQKFLKENQWVKRFLPNGIGTKELKNKRTKKQKSFSVSQFLSFLVDPLEQLAYRLQLAYMKSRKTSEITTPGRIRFHPKDAREWILKEYKERLDKLRIK